MKILNLRFKNINSLKGEWEIPFDHAPLANSGVFAITGPNGSGKTTILDSISLALYGETFRLKRPGESIMTHQTRDCFSEVTFSLGEAIYRSSWAASDSDTEQNSIEMKLVQLIEIEPPAPPDDQSTTTVEKSAAETETGIGEDSAAEIPAEADSETAVPDEAGETGDVEQESAASSTVDDGITEEQGDLTEIEVEPPKPKIDVVLLETQLSPVRARVTELTGLDFRRFSRSIMLAQGDFSAFLTALETERGEILEKITGTEVYQTFFDDFSSRVERSASDVKRLQQVIGDIVLLDHEKVKQLEEEHNELDEHCSHQQATFDRLAKIQAWFDARKRLDQSFKRDTSTLIEIDAQLVEREADLERVDQAQKAAAWQGDLDQLDDLHRQSVKASAVVDYINNEVGQHQQTLDSLSAQRADENKRQQRIRNALDIFELKKTIKKLAREVKAKQRDATTANRDVEKKQKEVDTLADWLVQREGDRALAENFVDFRLHSDRLKLIQAKLALAQGRYNAGSRVNSEELVVIKKLNRTIAKLEKNEKALVAEKNKLDDKIIALCGDATAATLNERLMALYREFEHYQRLFQIIKDRKKRLGEHAKISKVVDRNAEPLGVVKQKYAEAEALFEPTSKKWELVAGVVQMLVPNPDLRQALTELLNSYGAELQADQPCPLCGSCDHTGNDAVMQYEQLTIQLDEEQSRMEALSAQLQKLDFTAQLAMMDKQLRSLTMEWNNLHIMLGHPQGEINKASILLLKGERKRVEGEIRALEETIKKRSKYDQKIAKLESQIAERVSESARQRTELEPLEVNLSAEQKMLVELETELEIAHQEAEVERGMLRESLEAHGVNVPEKAERFYLELEARGDLFREQVGQLEQLRQELESLKAVAELQTQMVAASVGEQDECQSRIETLEATLAEQAGKTVKELRIAESAVTAELETTQHKSDDEKRVIRQKNEQVSEKSAELNGLKQSAEEQQETLLASARGDGFESIELLRDSLLSLEHQRAVRADWERTKGRSRDLQTRLEQNRKSLELEQAKALSSESEEDIAEQFVQAEARMADCREQLATIEGELQQDESMRQTLAENEQQLTQRTQQLSELMEEKAVMDGESAAQRQRRAQGMLFERLLQLSNFHLGKISGRYLLRQSEERLLGIEIEDSLQNNARRSVQTLSGGESFLASLALALGLADIANNGARIDSLFLDEGLGTLDAETLYTVISTLDMLHKNGKVIGVISHVKELQERIHTQIRAIKMPGGSSRLEIIS